MTEKTLSKHEKEYHEDLDYINDSRAYNSWRRRYCQWCNEPIDESITKQDKNGQIYIQCNNCEYRNYIT